MQIFYIFLRNCFPTLFLPSPFFLPGFYVFHKFTLAVIASHCWVAGTTTQYIQINIVNTNNKVLRKCCFFEAYLAASTLHIGTSSLQCHTPPHTLFMNKSKNKTFFLFTLFASFLCIRYKGATTFTFISALIHILHTRFAYMYTYVIYTKCKPVYSSLYTTHAGNTPRRPVLGILTSPNFFKEAK